jgi:hypothetical protein
LKNDIAFEATRFGDFVHRAGDRHDRWPIVRETFHRHVCRFAQPFEGNPDPDCGNRMWNIAQTVEMLHDNG